MIILHSFDQIESLKQPLVLTIGNFDGLHLGHRELLKRVQDISKKIHGFSALMTFEPHPMTVLMPERPLYRIFPAETQQKLSQALGLDYYLQIPFTKIFSTLTADYFLEHYLFKMLKPHTIVVGYDFGFGAQRQGSLALLQKQALLNGCQVEVIQPFHFDHQIVSSTKIREFINRGEVFAARRFLDQAFFVEGIVIKGDQRGRQLGFPTANLSTNWILKPRIGVYRTWTEVQGRRYYSMTNVGRNPTVSAENQEIKIETHLFNFDKDIYGEKIKVSFLDFVREEKKFSSLEQLKEQLAMDRKKIKDDFSETDQIL
jgi:riboflavin kinase/FMN adenylyltransferase